MFEAVLVSLADHGFTPTAIAARLTYTSAPESLQGALAAGLLGGGSRFLGVTEDAAQFLAAALAELRIPARRTTAGGTSWRLGLVERTKAAGRFVPGLGHPVHKVEDPADPGAVRAGPAARHVRRPPGSSSPPSAGSTPQVLGRTLPLNGAGDVRRGAGRPRPAAQRRCGASRCSPAAPVSSGTSPRSRPTRSAWTIYLSVDRNIDYRPPWIASDVPVAVSARWYGDR